MNQDQDYAIGTPIIFTKDIFTKPYPQDLMIKKGWKGIIKYKSTMFINTYEIDHIDEISSICIVCTTDQFKPLINEDMNKKTLLHYLRLPYNVNVDEMRKARYQAADELERLYELEERVEKLIIKLEKHDASCVHE
jgi:hypothetical protein